jgi:transposase
MNLTSGERMELERADGCGVAGIARITGASRPTVYKWIERYRTEGLAGLDDVNIHPVHVQ